MGAVAVQRMSVEEYLAADRAADIKSEYFDGEVFPIVGASLEHGRIAANLARSLGNRLDEGPCFVANSPVRIRSGRTRYLYPDLLLVCGKPVYTDAERDIVENPKVIIEVLSPSTADYDYGAKFRSYRKLASLQEYVLVSQSEHLIEVFRREPDRWTLHTYAGPDATLRLDSIGVEIPLAEIYRGVL